MIEPNAWGVTLAIEEHEIAGEFRRWNWGDKTDPVSVAMIVADMLREQTMADIDFDGLITMGLFEHEVPLTVSLTALVDGWIDVRISRHSGMLEDHDAQQGAALADLLGALAAKLRSKVNPSD